MNIARSPDGSVTLPASLINTLPLSDVFHVRVAHNAITLVPEIGKKRDFIAGEWKGLFGSVEEIDAMISDIRSEK